MRIFAAVVLVFVDATSYSLEAFEFRVGGGGYEGCAGEENGCGEGGELHCDGGSARLRVLSRFIYCQPIYLRPYHNMSMA